jgi:SAM-dependent methyltransferase
MRSQLDYYTFMGFNPQELKLRYAIYADRFLTGTLVLDLGCGRGEFLELLNARGVHGLGVDADSEMIAQVKSKGLEAVEGDATEYLRAHPAEFDGIFAAHLIEHLPPDDVEGLVAAAAGALKPAGRLILVTPNPHNLQMQLHDFWIDLQHTRFYSPDIVRWIVHRAGLREIEIGENPSYRSGPTLVNGPSRSASDRVDHAAGRLRARIQRKVARLMSRTPTRRRIVELERKANALMDWMRGLYPPAEYFATGIR